MFSLLFLLFFYVETEGLELSVGSSMTNNFAISYLPLSSLKYDNKKQNHFLKESKRRGNRTSFFYDSRHPRTFCSSPLLQ